MNKTISILKSTLLPAALGTISTLVFHFVLKKELIPSLEYTGVGLLVVAIILFFWGSFDANPRYNPKTNPVAAPLLKKSTDEARDEVKRLFGRRFYSVIWGVMGIIFLALPLLFWKG